jgi:hypothetical protein
MQALKRIGKPEDIADVVAFMASREYLIAEGVADLVAFGRPYIANPDLVQRFAENAPLAEVDWETVYSSGPRDYSDYPTYQQSQDNPGADHAKDNTPTEQGRMRRTTSDGRN